MADALANAVVVIDCCDVGVLGGGSVLGSMLIELGLGQGWTSTSAGLSNHAVAWLGGTGQKCTSDCVAFDPYDFRRQVGSDQLLTFRQEPS